MTYCINSVQFATKAFDTFEMILIVFHCTMETFHKTPKYQIKTFGRDCISDKKKADPNTKLLGKKYI